MEQIFYSDKEHYMPGQYGQKLHVYTQNGFRAGRDGTQVDSVVAYNSEHGYEKWSSCSSSQQKGALKEPSLSKRAQSTKVFNRERDKVRRNIHRIARLQVSASLRSFTGDSTRG